jgi:hypothetical protein
VLARSAEQAREWQLEQPRLQIPQCHSTAEIVIAAMPARPMLRTARAIAPVAARNVEGAAADDGAREHVSDDRAGRGSTVFPARPERPPAVAVTSASGVSFQSGVRSAWAHPPPTTGTRLRQRHHSDLGRKAPDDPRRPGVLPVREPGNDGSGHALRHRHAAGFPGRQVIAYVGDRGLAMLMAEFPTEIQHQLSVKVVINNNSPGQMLYEQMVVGYPQQGVRYPKSVRELRGTRRSQRRTRHQGGTSGRGPRRRTAGAQTAVLVLQEPERRRSDCAQSTPKLNASSPARWARTTDVRRGVARIFFVRRPIRRAFLPAAALAASAACRRR